MDKVGALLAVFGIASCVLYFLNMNLRVLMWIDSWGSTVGWVIRGGLIVVGGILFLLGRKKAAAAG